MLLQLVIHLALYVVLEYIIVRFVFDPCDCDNIHQLNRVAKIFSDNHMFHQLDQRTSLFRGTRAVRVSWKLLYIQMHDIACETAVRGVRSA